MLLDFGLLASNASPSPIPDVPVDARLDIPTGYEDTLRCEREWRESNTARLNCSCTKGLGTPVETSQMSGSGDIGSGTSLRVREEDGEVWERRRSGSLCWAAAISLKSTTGG